MKKLISLMIILLIILSFTNCSGKPVPKSNPVHDTPPQESEPLEEEKDELEEKAASIFSRMTLEEKIGQLLVVGFPRDISEEALNAYIDRFKVSGFILFRRNYDDFEALYTLVSELKGKNASSNPLPLFIAVDEEGGSVSRLPKGGTRFPDARLVGKADEPELTARIGEVIGAELKASGVNTNFAPVLDIVTDSENKLLIRRSYGSSSDTVAVHGSSFINGLQSTGVIAVPKHFPGHGSTTADSHLKLPMVDIDRATLQNRELVPFNAAISNGADAVMIGHIAFPKLDPSLLPATRSSYFLTKVLREELGFEGIAVSDDIEMSGYRNKDESFEEAVIGSFNAGIDIFLIGSTFELQERTFNSLLAACNDALISEERLTESVLRIIKTKLKYELSDIMDYSLEEAKAGFCSKEHKAVLEEVNNKIKAVK